MLRMLSCFALILCAFSNRLMSWTESGFIHSLSLPSGRVWVHSTATTWKQRALLCYEYFLTWILSFDLPIRFIRNTIGILILPDSDRMCARKSFEFDLIDIRSIFRFQFTLSKYTWQIWRLSFRRQSAICLSEILKCGFQLPALSPADWKQESFCAATNVGSAMHVVVYGVSGEHCPMPLACVSRWALRST